MAEPQTTEKITRGDYSFDMDGGYPKNVFNCHFFKVGTPGQQYCGAFGENAEHKACCSRMGRIIEDYKPCCTKHVGGDLSTFRHCKLYLDKIGEMSDKDRLRLRELELMTVNTRTAAKALWGSEQSNKIANEALIVTIIFAVVSLFNTLYIAKQQISIAKEQTNIIDQQLSLETNRDMPVVVFAEPEFRVNGEKIDLIYVLENIGGTPAMNVRVEIDVCGREKCPSGLWDDKVVNNLYPHIPQRFGFSSIPIDCSDGFLLIVNLEYNSSVRAEPIQRSFYYSWARDYGLFAVLQKDACKKIQDAEIIGIQVGEDLKRKFCE